MFKRLRKLVAVLAIPAAIFALSATPVHAGSNGQQIEFRDYLGSVYHICFVGYDQNGNYHNNDICWDTPGTDSDVNGYWWVGWVTINYYSAGWTWIGNNGGNTWVPTSQDTDWVAWEDATPAEYYHVNT